MTRTFVLEKEEKGEVLVSTMDLVRKHKLGKKREKVIARNILRMLMDYGRPFVHMELCRYDIIDIGHTCFSLVLARRIH